VIISPDDVFCVDEAWLSTDTAKKRLGHCVVEPANGDWDRERQTIEAALEESGGRVYGANGAAARLHIPPSTLDSKIKKLQIRKRHFKSLQTLLKTSAPDGNTISTNTTKAYPPSSAAFSDTYEWQTTCISKRASWP
jgi:hypothetical protein